MEKEEKKSERIAYIRVSTKDQNLDRQREALKDYNIDTWFEEKISAKDKDRPKLQEMLRYVRSGDSLYVTSFDRLARSLTDLLSICDFLKEKKVNIVSIKEDINSSTSNGRLMLSVIGAIAEFERSVIRERQAEGIALAKEKGVYAGRKPKNPPDFKTFYNLWKRREITLVQLAKSLEISRSTAYRLIKKHEQNMN